MRLYPPVLKCIVCFSACYLTSPLDKWYPQIQRRRHQYNHHQRCWRQAYGSYASTYPYFNQCSGRALQPYACLIRPQCTISSSLSQLATGRTPRNSGLVVSWNLTGLEMLLFPLVPVSSIVYLFKQSNIIWWYIQQRSTSLYRPKVSYSLSWVYMLNNSD